MNKQPIMPKEEIKMLKTYYGFSEGTIKKLEQKNQLSKVIEKIKMEHFSQCKGI